VSIKRPEEFKHFEQQLPGVKLHYVREGAGPAPGIDARLAGLLVGVAQGDR
jgi:hypothetical protein